jgi:hypothetical protein
MELTFIRISQSLSCAKTLHSVFENAMSLYPVQNSKSLIAMPSHKNTVHIVTTKAMFWK